MCINLKNLIFLFLASNCFRCYSIGELDKLAIKHGTDKSSKFHGYVSVYEEYFSAIKNGKIKLLEIGIDRAWSAAMWEEYFTNAVLYFIDNNPKSIKIGEKVLSSRSKCYVVDQSNKNELIKFINNIGGDLDIVIDDGGHHMHQQLISFEVLFPYIKSGGVYIIEDLHTSYWPTYGGKASPGVGTTINFLKNLIDDVNFVGARTECANFSRCPNNIIKLMNYYQLNIKAMHFYDSMCFIFKR